MKICERGLNWIQVIDELGDVNYALGVTRLKLVIYSMIASTMYIMGTKRKK